MLTEPLKQLRLSRKMSYEDLAVRLGQSASRVGQVETGTSGEPTIRVVARHARACGYRMVIMFVPAELAPLPRTDDPAVCIVPIPKEASDE